MPLNRNWRSGLLILTLLVAACESGNRDYRHDFHAFGTFVSVSFYGTSSESNKNASREIRALYDELGSNWYPWWPGELQRINKAIAAGQTIEVSERLASLIQAAANYERESHGRFNAGLAHLSELWGLQPVPKELAAPPDAAVLAALLDTRPSLLAISWNESTLSVANPNLMLDLGGIAKGAILALSTELLQSHDIHNAIVNIGGDLTVIGNVNGTDAHIGIRSPFRDAPIAGINIADGESVVTSGNYERYIEIAGERYTHIFDPATGYPVAHTASVTVVDRDPLRADAAATALLVGGAGHFDELVDAMQLEYVLLVEASGDTRLTPAMAERVHWLDREITH